MGFDLMDHYTSAHSGGTSFNYYLVSTYVDHTSARFTFDHWNFYEEINEGLPRINNHVEGFNRRINSIFPSHPHIFDFIKNLREEHIYQHYRAEESMFHIRKRKKISEDIDSMLKFHWKNYERGNLSGMGLAIKCGETLKINFKVK